MGRRGFVRDLQEASSPGKYPRMVNVKSGDDDGVISCTYAPEIGNPIDIQLLISELSSYPKEHDYFVYTTSDDVPAAATEALEEVQTYLHGLRLSETVTLLTNALDKSFSPHSDEDMDMPDVADASDEEYGWSPRSPKGSEPLDDKQTTGPPSQGVEENVLAKMAADLRAAKLAGFRVGYVGNPGNPIICISCKVSKLGISDEAMQAWHVDANQYLVCLIRYIDRYRSLEEIIQEDTAFGKVNMEFQADLCDSYKPTLQSALTVFNRNVTKPETGFGSTASSSANQEKLRKMTRSFISKPLNTLLNERFIKILRYRHMFGFPWAGAELFFNDVQGKSLTHADLIDPKYMKAETLASSSTALPAFVTADHLIEKPGDGASFPLITMQFVLRHFVRCTEFCLVCHCKTEDAFEALKPYVCSKSLCLYQYMALGFGPSLEWEIISQPYVVDLLVSFTYASAKQDRLKDFPTGLGLLVPAARVFSGTGTISDAMRESLAQDGVNIHDAKFDRSKMELLFPSEQKICPVRAGDWIVVCNPLFTNELFHCLVKETAKFPSVSLSGVVPLQFNGSRPTGTSDKQALVPPGYCDVSFVIYELNFDALSPNHKQVAISMLLDTLPSVDAMKEFLLNTSQKAEPVLTDWRCRISKSALDVLRWVVASNRSCIIQDDQTAHATSSYNDNDRVSGMDAYMQFRFAQGAPDKEQRFVQAVAAATERLNLKYPTIFAWHGSSLANWHGILREGLHFKETLHGRAYGHGVYMSPQFSTSQTYAAGPAFKWPQSKLKITSAISLNEVVNAPNEFVSRSPHLVVSQLDWIQPRYLFVAVQPEPTTSSGSVTSGPVKEAKSPSAWHWQDPAFSAIGPSGKPIQIPVTAVSKRRRLGMTAAAPESPEPASSSENINFSLIKGSRAAKAPLKKKLNIFGDGALFKKGVSGAPDTEKPLPSTAGFSKDFPIILDGDVSEDTDKEDILILLDDKQDRNSKVDKGKGKAPAVEAPPAVPKTDFVPGTLNSSTLPLLAQPQTATPWATKALLRDLNATLKIQETQPAHELGWYVDPSITSTPYQWIVELHSFDPSLPLTTDLKQAGLKSIVLELRFASDYPISPPFVRVIRPRFLSFLSGGGGHVTAGGALCMELLTNSGWSAVSSIESVLLQVRMAISSTEPKPARLQPGQSVAKGTVRDYAVAEAVEAYLRACRMHGWEVPKEFASMARGGLLETKN
ncbi:hypothetical protein AJ79_03402 [Helicocarpus griseus UAMH5409]|uniref:UBC core domain-containing protein n=1 Tax=Helicocarpus griseus UAMH5409 TaxID=1447875 RepID=A0A2B7XPZ2_9EURO|nr:hypothetical protein AJ79_03402 [Helicocarpus griseus UAMH5409]